MQAGWADPASVEGVSFMPTGAKPLVVLARRPAAERAADARGFGLAGFLVFLKLAVWSNGGSHRSLVSSFWLTEFSLLRQSCSDSSRSRALPCRVSQRT